MTEPGKEVANWADPYMFEAQDIAPNQEMQVDLISCNNDPLGSIAWAAKAYKGEFVRSLAEITDNERRYYLEQIQKTALAMPLEAVQFGFSLSAVTRGFTHQMVRQRTAAYSQESTRFAVKSGMPVGLPPSLQGCDHPSFRTVTDVFLDAKRMFPHMTAEQLHEWTYAHVTEQANWYETWCETIETIQEAYNKLVNAGMPAEDARGLLPTNLLTRINYITNLRNFKAEAGKRLCTQAQFEWRIAFSKFAEAIRRYGESQTYLVKMTQAQVDAINDHIKAKDLVSQAGIREYGKAILEVSSQWQFDAIADLFRPVCYYTGKCEFLADFDRKCTIRDRVDANHAINRPSDLWHLPLHIEGVHGYDGVDVSAIQPAEWLLDPGAAR